MPELAPSWAPRVDGTAGGAPRAAVVSGDGASTSVDVTVAMPGVVVRKGVGDGALVFVVRVVVVTVDVGVELADSVINVGVVLFVVPDVVAVVVAVMLVVVLEIVMEDVAVVLVGTTELSQCPLSRR